MARLLRVGKAFTTTATTPPNSNSQIISREVHAVEIARNREEFPTATCLSPGEFRHLNARPRDIPSPPHQFRRTMPASRAARQSET